MITASTPALSVSLPDRFMPNQALTAPEALALGKIFHQRLRAFLNAWLLKGMSPNEAQLNLDALAQSYEFTPRPAQEFSDPITIEALRIARELVTKRLASQGIDLDDEALARHSAQVAQLAPVRKRAEEIVTIRQKTAQSVLKQAEIGDA